jgi:glutamyl-tRNA reductase
MISFPMNFLCLGLNHQTAPLQLRERLVVSEQRTGELLAELLQVPGVSEAVVLSTCNRVEVYAAAENHPAAGKKLLATLGGDVAADADATSHFYFREGEDAVGHLFSVAAGLDSMVLGETEIFGQVKKAYETASGHGATGPLLNRLFQRSFAVGKRVRNSTGIQKGATSVGSVAVELAERIFGDLEHCSVMLLGAGEMSRVTARSLLSRGARSIFVSNRSFERAVELAAEMDGVAMRFDDWPRKVAEVDIVIASTAAPHFVVTPDQVLAARKLRKGRPLFLIDIAVPRNIDPAVNAIDDIYLYDLDALQVLADEARRQREEQIQLCRVIIGEEVERLANQLSQARRLHGIQSPGTA